MAKTKTKGKKATKPKGKRNATPALDNCPYTANFTLPHTTESSGAMATELAEFQLVKDAHTAEVRKAYAAGTDLPELPVKAFFDPNKGLQTRKQYEAYVEAHNDALDAGRKTPAALPRYNPIAVQAVHAMNCSSLRKGTLKKFTDEKGETHQPKDWDEAAWGSWWHEYEEDGETVQEASGWHIDTNVPRPCHALRAELLIDDPDVNILTFGNNRYVVGTGTHDNAACFMIWQTSHGNYRAGDAARKRMSLAGIKEIRNIVFRIEDRPNNGGGVTVKGEWKDVREMVYMPGQVLTAGNLFDKGGSQLDAKAIRGLDADTKGLRFKALEAPIVGKAIPWEQLWEEIKGDKPGMKKMRARGGRSDEYEAGSVETKSITNICVNGKRVDPCEANPFGVKGSQAHQPAYLVASGEGKVEDGFFSMGVVVGARGTAKYNVSIKAAKAALAETETVEAPAPKPKSKPKTEPKTKATKPKAPKAPKADPKPKTTKPKAPAKPKDEPKPADAAPPVEADTADEPEVVEPEGIAGEQTVVAVPDPGSAGAL